MHLMDMHPARGVIVLPDRFSRKPLQREIERCNWSPNVRFGSKADMRARSADVCFTHKSGHRLSAIAMSAMYQKRTRAVQQTIRRIRELVAPGLPREAT